MNQQNTNSKNNDGTWPQRDTQHPGGDTKRCNTTGETNKFN